MPTSRAVAVCAFLSTVPPVLAQPLITPARPGVERGINPANFHRCLWLGKTHAEHAPARGGVPGMSTTLISNGDPANRIDLVIVGDGYTASELGEYAQHAQLGVDDLFAIMPFSLYEPLFNVHRVDVISNESGVDDDPRGVERDTALNMSFWCGGIQRLLCVDTFRAQQAASNAPDWDQIFAVANASTYGGAGYPSQNVGTYSGANSAAPQVAIHELGHSLGNLADEYTYGGPETYTGPEPSARNVSIFNADQQEAQDRKWSDWLGVDHPDFDGLVDAYEGGNYSENDIYRPTSNSIMRSLGQEFNLPSAEGLIIEMWKIVQPIDSHTSNLNPVLPSMTLEVQLAAPFLSVRWFLNGNAVGTGPSLDLHDVSLPSGMSTLHVVVVDDTPLVRDETAREAYMTQRVYWSVEGAPGDLTGDGVVDSVDLAVLLAAWGGPGVDFDGDGVCSSSDLAILLAAWG